MEKIYDQRGLGYFAKKAGSTALEFANPITGPANTISTVAEVMGNHIDGSTIGWIAAPGLMLAHKLFVL